MHPCYYLIKEDALERPLIYWVAIEELQEQVLGLGVRV